MNFHDDRRFIKLIFFSAYRGVILNFCITVFFISNEQNPIKNNVIHLNNSIKVLYSEISCENYFNILVKRNYDRIFISERDIFLNLYLPSRALRRK